MKQLMYIVFKECDIVDMRIIIIMRENLKYKSQMNDAAETVVSISIYIYIHVYMFIFMTFIKSCIMTGRPSHVHHDVAPPS